MRFDKVDFRYLGGVTLLASILLITFSAMTSRGTDWWAAWGQWVGGIGSIAAAAVAIWIAFEGWRRTDAQLATAEARSQASQIGVWLDWTDRDNPKVAYHNNSQLPIQQVGIALVLENKIVGGGMFLWTLNPTTEPTELPDATDSIIPVLHEALYDFVSEGPMDQRNSAQIRIRSTARFLITFTDTNNVHWLRGVDGRLVQRLD
jgi:hypothetical protein